MSHEIICPDGWAKPVGYSNGILAAKGRLLFLGGQVAFDTDGKLACRGDLVGQVRQTLENLEAVVKKAGGRVEDIVKLTIFVDDKDDYTANSRGIGAAWVDVFGKHFPAMTLVEISRFYEDGVLVEIEGLAVIPDSE